METQKDLYKTMYLIRHSEEKIIEYYFEDEMKTPMHMSVGEEAIAAGVCAALKKEDQITGTFRSHAIYLAKTKESDLFFAEMYGKITGCGKGKSGSMHLSSKEFGFICASAIVASSIPVAVGAAFAQKYNGTENIVVAFFGDGALEEGVFWESINFACVQKLPVLFVCEDNGLAVHEPWEKTKGYHSIKEVIDSYNCDTYFLDTTDVGEIYDETQKIVDNVRSSGKPAFLQAKYYRYLEHVGVNKDFNKGYRTEAEFLKWYEKDPLKVQREKLEKQLGVTSEEIRAIEEEIENQVAASIAFAQRSALASEQELYKDVFAI